MTNVLVYNPNGNYEITKESYSTELKMEDNKEARANGLEEAKERLKDYENMIDDPYASVNAKDVAEDLKTIIRLLEVGIDDKRRNQQY